jgi:hypothetical protein
MYQKEKKKKKKISAFRLRRSVVAGHVLVRSEENENKCEWNTSIKAELTRGVNG